MIKTSIKTWLIISIILSISIYIQSHIFVSWDVSWLVIATKRVLNGGTYFQNFFEPNPPLILYLYILPVLTAKYLSTNATSAVQCTTFIISLLSLILSQKLLNLILPKESRANSIFMVMLAFVYFILPVGQFAQREHWLILLTTPYFLTAVTRCKRPISAKLAIIVGILAGLGFALKPYFLLPSFLVEIYLISITKRWQTIFRIETFAIGFILLIYIPIAFLLNPTYFQYIIPIAWHYFIGFARVPWHSLLNNLLGLNVVAAAITTLVFLRRHRQTHLLWVINLAMFGFMFAFIIQGQPWYYHAIPMFSFSLLSLTACLSLANIHLKPALNKQIIFLYTILTFAYFTLALSIGYLIMANYDKIRLKASSHYQLNQIIHYVKNNANRGYIYAFAMRPLYNATISEYANVKTASRFPAFWPLPAIIHARHSNNITKKINANKTAKLIQAGVVMDFLKHSPVLVIVNSSKYNPYVGALPFDFIAFFRENKTFRQIWQHYHNTKKFGAYAVYMRDKT